MSGGGWGEGDMANTNRRALGYSRGNRNFGDREKDGHKAWRSTCPFSFFSIYPDPEVPLNGWLYPTGRKTA